MSSTPPSAFTFEADFGDGTHGSFSEVSGLSVQLAVEKVQEGGVNAYVHALPGVAKHENIVLKRGVIDRAGPFWQPLQSLAPIVPETVTIRLRGPAGETVAVWTLAQAYAIALEIGAESDGMFAVEQAEIAYASFSRG